MTVVEITKACYGYMFFLVLISAKSLSFATYYTERESNQRIPIGPGAVLLEPSLAYEDEKCGTISVNECFKKIHTFLRITQLPFATEEKQLDALCKQSLEGYNCSSTMFNNPNCLSPKDKDILPIFISMAQFTFFMLCGDLRDDKGYLRDAFLGYSGCIMENKAKMDCCAEGSSVPDMPVLRILEDSSKNLATREIQTCCPVTRYLKCTTAVVTENCGEAAANFTMEYIRRAAGEQIQQICQKIPKYPDPDDITCPGPVLLCSGSSRVQLQQCLILSALGLAILPRILRFYH